MSDLAHDLASTSPAAPAVAAPTERLLAASLLLAPVTYLAVDCSYAVQGWDHGPTAAAHLLAAAVYGLAALALVRLVRGWPQAVLLVVAVLGVIGNAGVAENSLHIALGGNDLFEADGPANVFKTMGFFFPLTFVVAAVALRRRAAAWWPPLLVVGALLFPVAHVGNISWLAIIDGLVMLAALGSCRQAVRP
jgi:hypothetical protein